MISRDVILAGARAYAASAGSRWTAADREAIAQQVADSPAGYVYAAIVAAVQADREQPWDAGTDGIPAQRAGCGFCGYSDCGGVHFGRAVTAA